MKIFQYNTVNKVSFYKVQDFFNLIYTYNIFINYNTYKLQYTYNNQSIQIV